MVKNILYILCTKHVIFWFTGKNFPQPTLNISIYWRRNWKLLRCRHSRTWRHWWRHRWSLCGSTIRPRKFLRWGLCVFLRKRMFKNALDFVKCVWKVFSHNFQENYKLLGTQQTGARFGSAITSLGDIDYDNYNGR